MNIITNVYITGLLDNGRPHVFTDVVIEGVTIDCPLPHWHLIDSHVTVREDDDLQQIAKACDDFKGNVYISRLVGECRES